MAATHPRLDPPESGNGRTVHVVATSVEGTRAALDAATALARGLCGRVVLFVRRASPDPNRHDQDIQDTTTDALRRLADSYTPPPRVLSWISERALDVVQLFQSPGVVLIGGEGRLWWPTAEQRLAQALSRLGCQVTFVHVPRRRFVPPLVEAAREWAARR
jgi:hypothetical protein